MPIKKIYNVNWFKLVRDLILPTVKKSVLLAFIDCSLAPIRTKHDEFLRFKTDSEYRINHNGQVCYLQKMLNDKFDNTLRRIRVNNLKPRLPLWIYTIDDDKPIYIHTSTDYPVYIYNDIDYYLEYDFEVFIPYSLNSFKNQMNAQINYYKLSYIIF